MSTAMGVNGAWAALLPQGTVWRSGWPHRAGRPTHGRRRAAPARATVAVPAPPWALRDRWRHTRRSSTQVYVAVPSRQDPLVVSSGDPEVLRYLADAVLSVPPGMGSAASFLLTLGLRLLRYRTTWIVAAALHAGDVVAVGAP